MHSTAYSLSLRLIKSLDLHYYLKFLGLGLAESENVLESAGADPADSVWLEAAEHWGRQLEGHRVPQEEDGAEEARHHGQATAGAAV